MNQENLNNKQEISETKTTDVALTSTMFAEDAGSGLENVTSEDMAIPRLKILQALSPEVNKNDGKYVEGASAVTLSIPLLTTYILMIIHW